MSEPVHATMVEATQAESPLVPCVLDWTDIPPLQELEELLAFKYSMITPGILAYPHYYAPPTPSVPFKLTPTDYVVHGTSSEDEVLELYAASGFDTFVVLQNPLTHRGASPACPIGFTSNLPTAVSVPELKAFRRWVCRLHVDICRHEDQRLVSVPHVEIDPGYHPLEHLSHQGREVKGKAAVEVLKKFLE